MPATDDSFESLLEYLKRNRGFDFTGYKRSTIMRRVQRRMQQLNIGDFTSYVDYLEVDPEEFVPLFNTILINVTGFFRDMETWEFIAAEIVPKVLASKQENEPIRVWSAGCSSGEEAFTLAMLFGEAMGMDEFRNRVKIYATDVDEEALQFARQASYSDAQVEKIPAAYLERYFEDSGGRHLFHKDMRRAVIFGRHDLIQDAPISRVDLLMCRNTLMYFNAETQSRVISRFHFALRPGAFLVLGRAEMLLSHGNAFTSVALKHRIFTVVNRMRTGDSLPLLTHVLDGDSTNGEIAKTRLRESAFDSSIVAQLVLDPEGILILANERARSLFGLTSRDLGQPFSDLEVSYRPAELRSRIDLARSERRSVQLQEVPWNLNFGEPNYFEISVTPLTEPSGEVLGTSLVFTDVTPFKHLQYELRQANEELETAYEELQSTNEELETMNEELQSTIEELETTNEELQSTNEELETMNEELQSTNEELHTINDQLTQRGDELNRVNDYLTSIMENVQGGVIVLDRELRVKGWNRKSVQLWGLRADEVQEKHLQNLGVKLPFDEVVRAIHLSWTENATSGPLTIDAQDRWGEPFQCSLTCTPMEAADGVSAGVILVMNKRDGQQA